MSDSAASTALNFTVRGFSFQLRAVEGRLGLKAAHLPAYGAVEADWLSDEVKRRIKAGKKQQLAKAVGLHKKPDLHILDATAGLGRDAFTLAALGATVTMVERHPALVRLLQDAYVRAQADDVAALMLDRVQIIQSEAKALLMSATEVQWDVIYLDPMYPDDGKSALPSKEMQIIRDLTGGDVDADELLPLALLHAHKVVVKRPSKAPWLADCKPALSLKGTQARFDIYLPA
jgi:16S rRNA (guanine1516-N2)-methyltransferase